MMRARAVVEEAEKAAAKYGDFQSTHEALGVLTEEVRELEDAIRSNDLASVGREAMQVAAVALRLYNICLRAMLTRPDGDASNFRTRSGS